jgi:hypothetical protein
LADSFSRKRLRATLTLLGPNQTFAGTNNNVLTLDEFRMSATLTAAGNWTNFLDLTIFGVRQQDMNALTVLWAGPDFTAVNSRASVALESNDGGGWFQVFQGQFQQAQPNYQEVPDANITIYAAAGFGQQIASAPPSSYTGGASVATIAQSLASQMGFNFENNGVSAQLHTPYFPGTLMDQFRQLCDHANIDYYFDANETLIICPKNQGRIGKTTIPVSPQSGMVGYPTVQQYGVNVKVLFLPQLALGNPIDIQSDIPGANGKWFPQRMVAQLESWKPGGQWFASLDCYPFSAATP